MDAQHSLIINATSLIGQRTGIGKTAYEILKRDPFSDRFDLTYFYGYFSKKLIAEADSNHQNLSFLRKNIRKIPIAKKIVRELLFYTIKAKSKKFDLYWEPNIVPIAAINTKKTVITLHDLSVLKFPHWHLKDSVDFYKNFFNKKIYNLDFFIFDSSFIQNEFLNSFPISADRTHCIHLGVDQDTYKIVSEEIKNEIRIKYQLNAPFILFVGSIEPRKNLKTLLSAYSLLPISIKQQVKLLLVGFSGWKNREIMQMIQQENQNIRYLGFVPEKDLAGIYNLAEIFVFPSFYEGFGLPPLEAMACGLPVISSNGGSLPEVCGNAAYYFVPESIEDLNGLLKEFLISETMRKKYTEKSLNHIKQYSWNKAAQQHKYVFDNLL